jgi:hypothetical protein
MGAGDMREFHSESRILKGGREDCAPCLGLWMVCGWCLKVAHRRNLFSLPSQASCKGI